jgi:hypothetical protein
MGLFSSILEKLGFGQKAEASKPAPAEPTPTPSPAPEAAPVETPHVVAISEVDVVAMLDGLAASNPQKLNWKTSIVDLLKLLDLDSAPRIEKGACDRTRLPQGEDGRLRPDEHVAA